VGPTHLRQSFLQEAGDRVGECARAGLPARRPSTSDQVVLHVLAQSDFQRGLHIDLAQHSEDVVRQCFSVIRHGIVKRGVHGGG